MSGLSFDELVTAAALGVSRKGFTVTELDGPAARYTGAGDPGDPAAALLDAAALLTVAQRAGIHARQEFAVPADGPAGVGGGELELSVRGARLLARLAGLDQRGELARSRAGLLGDLLAAMRDAGYVLPAPLLPGLLDAAARVPALAPLVAPVLGARGRWLAGHRAGWRQVAGAGPARGTDGGAAAGPAAADGGPDAWRVGTPRERRAYLAGLRGQDPRAGRELLAAGWARESRQERAELVSALARGLSGDDEEFLEKMLSDRAGEVRAAARRLLAWLPGSAFSRRAAERAAAVLRLEGGGAGARLIAHVPPEADKAAVEDGIEPRSPVGWVDSGAWRLSQLIAGAPLADWTARFGLAPGELVTLPVTGAAAIDVRAGWRLAAIRQAGAGAAGGNAGDPELTDWALALLGADLGTVNRPASVWPPDTALADLLPAGPRGARAAALLAAAGAHPGHPQAYPARAELASHPVPWPAVLADAVLDAMAHEVLRPKPTVLAQAVVETAGRGMPATGPRDYAAELTRLAHRMPQSWMPEVHAAAETIALRRAFLAELR